MIHVKLLVAIGITDEVEAITLTLRSTKFIGRKIFIKLKRITRDQGLPVVFVYLEI